MSTNESLEMMVEELRATVESLTQRVEELEGRRPVTTRDRGPKSERKMSEEDAFRILYGDLSDAKVKDIAETLGLSRGQVYSVRGGYTFTYVTEDYFDKK